MMEAVFVGRSEEVARGQRAVDEASNGKGGLLLFSGEAGLGKTRLADEIASLAAKREARVVWGRCWEAGGAPAYWPWIQIFRALGVEDDLFSGDDREVRFRQFDRAASRLKQIASDKLLVVVLDDLHTADVPSLLFFHFLARDLRSTRLLVLGTYREAEARLAPDVLALLAKIAREGDSIPLPRLSREAVLDWIRARAPDADDATAERVHRTTEGNALFVQELLRVRGTPSEGELPDGLRSVLDEHLARVPAGVRDVLAKASVLGRDVEAPIVATLSSLPLVEVEVRLRAALEAGLLSSLRGGKRLAFAHILVRERLYAELAPGQRAELHVAVAEQLIAEGGDPSTIAHHLVEGRAATSSVRAASALLAAARSAMSRLAFEDAARLARIGIELIDRDPSEESAVLAADLELTAGEALMIAGESKVGQETCIRAAERAKRVGSPDRMAKAALTYALDIVTGAVDVTMIALIESALAALPVEDSSVRAKLLARHASACVPPRTAADVPQVLESATAAMSMADRLADDDTTLYVYKFGSSAMGYLVSSDERTRHIDRIMPLVEKLGRTVELLNTGGWWIANLRERGDIVGAHAVLEKMKRAVAEYPQAHYRWRIPMLEAQKALFAGDVDEAERLGREASSIDSTPMAKMHFALHRFTISFVRRDSDVMKREIQDGVFALFSRIPVNPFAGWLALASGDRDAARKHVVSSLLIRESYPQMLLAAQTALDLEDRELCADIYPDLRRFTETQFGFWSSHGALFVGPTQLIAGRLAAFLEKRDEARALLEDSVRVCERMQSVPHLELSKRALSAVSTTAAPRPPQAERRPSAITMERDGDVWAITAEGKTIRVKDTKGLAYLADLVMRPGQDLHVTQLAELADPVSGDAGPVLDAKAKAAYKERVEALRAEIEEANRFGDFTRAERAEREIDSIAHQIASAVGLGGRDRKIGSQVERARINVQRRLKDAIQRIAEHDPALGKYLSAAVKTGTYCSFTPF